MHANLDIQLSEGAFAALAHQAVTAGKTPAELAAAIVERACGEPSLTPTDAAAAKAQFEAHFGSIDLGRPIGVANPTIDADLARAYDNATGSH
jgi:hypothetical protein